MPHGALASLQVPSAMDGLAVMAVPSENCAGVYVAPSVARSKHLLAYNTHTSQQAPSIHARPQPAYSLKIKIKAHLSKSLALSNLPLRHRLAMKPNKLLGVIV